MKIFNRIASMASLTAICLNFTAASLHAEWNPSVVVAGQPISQVTGNVTGTVLTNNSLNNALSIWAGRSGVFPDCSFCQWMYVAPYTFGSGWGTPVVISDTSLLPPPYDDPEFINLGDPDIMMNDSGYAVAVWEGDRQVINGPSLDVYRCIFGASRASDGTWSPMQTIRIAGLIDFYPQNPSVAVNESGLGVTMWNEVNGDPGVVSIMTSFLPFGGAWTTPVQLDFSSFGNVIDVAGDVEINDNGDAVAIWQILDNVTSVPAIRAATYNPATNIWTTVSLDANPGFITLSSPPEVAIDPNGNAVAVWRNQNGAVGSLVAAYYTKGLGWGAPVIVYTTPFGTVTGPYVVMDNTGTATAIWNNNNTGEVFSSRLPFGGTWTAPELIGNGSFDPFSVQEAASVDNEGNVIVIIKVGDDFQAYLQSILRTVQGGWQPPENIFSDLRQVDFLNIGLGSCGFALSLWKEGSALDDTMTVSSSDTTNLAGFLSSPPTNFVGSRCCQKFVTQTTCVTRLSWDPVTCAASYLIRANGELIATVLAPETSYVDGTCYSCNTGEITYTLSVVNINGVESEGVTIVVTVR